ncbi:MAG: hypothetical protein AB7O80_17330, partial [Acetobacteraceae bacterium]
AVLYQADRITVASGVSRGRRGTQPPVGVRWLPALPAVLFTTGTEAPPVVPASLPTNEAVAAYLPDALTGCGADLAVLSGWSAAAGRMRLWRFERAADYTPCAKHTDTYGGPYPVPNPRAIGDAPHSLCGTLRRIARLGTAGSIDEAIMITRLQSDGLWQFRLAA